MALVPCCRVQWLLMITVSLTCGLSQAESFPGQILHYPSNHYVIQGQDFNTSCVVTLDVRMTVDISFTLQSSGVLLSNSNNVIVTSAETENQVTGILTIRNATFSSKEVLTCSASGYLGRKLVNVNRTSTIHSVIVPFVITDFPAEELQLSTDTPYSLSCVVTVDKNYPLEGVTVSIQYSPISLDYNMPTEVHTDKEVIEESRTLTATVFIRDVERKFGGTYECSAETYRIQNATVPNYRIYRRTRIIQAPTDSQSSQDSNDEKSLVTLLLVFSAITITLLIVFTLLVVAVIWTKKHRSKNYPVSPFLGTIPTTSTSAKSNYYSDSPENSAVNKIAMQPAMALHITPRLQSISSVETDL